jgi:uroporphyrinogen decarboxylase
MNMYSWMEQIIHTEKKKPLPILAYPAVQYILRTVREVMKDPDHLAIGMRLIADKYDMPASFGYMDLSVEAEAFGAYAAYPADEIPTIIGKLIEDEAAADRLQAPAIGAARTGIYLETMRKALMLIHDRPVFAQCIGPYSLAGRLMNVNDIMLQCYESPEVVHKVLRKVTDFLRLYALEFKSIGAHGIVLAEPLAGLLSPELMKEFSMEYVREIVDAVQDKHFLVVYHNCGSAVSKLIDEITDTGCFAYHFGESVDMKDILEKLPRNYLVMGNISAAKVFDSNSTDHVRIETLKLLRQCAKYNNFILSSGCDIPPNVDLDNIDTFFQTSEDYYYRLMLRNIIS